MNDEQKDKEKPDKISVRTVNVKVEKKYSDAKGIHDVFIGKMKGECVNNVKEEFVKVSLSIEASSIEVLERVMPLDLLESRYFRLIVPDQKLTDFAEPDAQAEATETGTLAQFVVLPEDDKKLLPEVTT